jgi:aerobic-type carbon monoxide dehydrogenase small subunit (CoxS/CutS family)
VSEHPIRLRVNGSELERTVPSHQLLREFLRDDLDLTGTKSACDDGMCGACAVLLDGVPVKSCLVLAVEAEARAVVSVEGLADGETLHPVQAALAEHFAVQCGFCTPGFATTLAGYLTDTPAPTADELRAALAGNICRCTGYVRIVDAGMDAAERLRLSR